MATGKEILDIAKPHIGEEYILGTLAPKNKATYHGPWDCAELVSWSVYQVSGMLYGCDNDHGNPATANAYTGFWHRDAQTLGKIISIEEAARTPGAAVLRVPKAGRTGHIVISDGHGGTVEAHSHLKGVIASVINGRRWDMGILVPGIDYTLGAGEFVHTPPAVVYRVTSPMMSGATVQQIQEKLEALGFRTGGVDGKYGPRTANAVFAFQLARGIVPDGEVGPDTAALLGIPLA